jgi:hypothetical protein
LTKTSRRWRRPGEFFYVHYSMYLVGGNRPTARERAYFDKPGESTGWIVKIILVIVIVRLRGLAMPLTLDPARCVEIGTHASCVFEVQCSDHAESAFPLLRPSKADCR